MNPFIRCAVSLAGLVVLAQPAAAEGDLGGIWAVAAPVKALRTVAGKQPPLLPEALAQYQQRLAAARKGDRSWDPVAKCKPPGEPRTLFEMGWPFEIMQSAGRIDVLFQWNRLDRAIAMADHQTPDALAPFYFGQSIGRWEGDTLVVSVISVRDSAFLDSTGLPHSDDMELTERFRTLKAGAELELTLHVDDPATYSEPWDARVVFKRQPAGTRIAEDVCIARLKLADYATIENSLAPASR